MPKLLQLNLSWMLQRDPIYGAYTEAFAELSPEVDEGMNLRLCCSVGKVL